jgi:predicted neuraminidase
MLAAPFLALILAAPTAIGELKIERVFGKEIPTGPYKHPACMTDLDNGDLYLVYYGGDGEYAVNTGVFGSRKAKGEPTWSTPVTLAHDPFRSVGNAVIWQAPDGLVWLFYVVRYGDVWSSSRIQFKVSSDRAQTWSDASVLSEEPGMMVRNRPIVLSRGDYLLPIYHEVGDDPESVGHESTSRFLRFDPKLKAWSQGGIIHSAKGNIQPAVVEIEPGHLIAYCRRGGGYTAQEKGYIVRAESSDFGETWSEGVDSEFKNPNAAVDFLKLQSGRLLLIFNDSFIGRFPLTAALSEDLAKSFPIRRNVLEGPGDFGYPIVLQGRDGTIHLVYTSERRSVVNHATFDEQWLLEGH